MNHHALLIDLDGTIHNYLAAATIAKQVLADAIAGQFQIDAAEVLKCYSAICANTEWSKFPSGHGMRNTRMKLLLNSWSVSRAADPSVFVALFSHAYLEAIQPFPGAIEIIRTWHREGRPMAIVTEGFGDIQRAVLEYLKNAGLVELPVTISKEHGVTKTDGSAIRHALGLLDATAEKTVMIGDNWDFDILPAAQIGLAQIWIAKQKNPPTIPKSFLGVAGSLKEANRLLVDD